jgi:hypothetical protein
MSQNAQILAHLKRGKGLTPQQALGYWGVMRLAARVNNLRDAGHDIHTTIVYRGGKKYARYTMGGTKSGV